MKNNNILKYTFYIREIIEKISNFTESALTGELKICRMDKLTSSVEGGEEIFILVEKVGKSNY